MSGWYVLIFAAACWLPAGALIDQLDIEPEQWLAARLAAAAAFLIHLIELAGRHR